MKHDLIPSKSFDFSVEVVGGKLRGIIEERGRGLSAWIRFGDLSLCSLFRDEGLVRWSKAWEEG